MQSQPFDFDFDFNLHLQRLKMMLNETELKCGMGHIIGKVSMRMLRICNQKSDLVPPKPSILAKKVFSLKP
jgi:hypothetical protein